MERTRQYRSASAASRGSNSPIRVPGTEVAIGLYGPRTSSGASGFGSQVSIWLAPPYWHTKMHDFARARAGTGRDGYPPAASNSGSDRPSIPSPPTRSNCRRVGLCQNSRQGWSEAPVIRRLPRDSMG